MISCIIPAHVRCVLHTDPVLHLPLGSATVHQKWVISKITLAHVLCALPADAILHLPFELSNSSPEMSDVLYKLAAVL